MTAILEYLTAEILELAYVQSIKTGQSDISHRHIFLAIHYDKELLFMYESFQLQMIGAGVQPRHLESDHDSNLILPKKTFEQLTQHILKSANRKELSKKSTTFLQSYLESFMCKLLVKTDRLCTQFDKKEIRSQDLTHVFSDL
jgi:histone H3/H4